MIVSPFGFFQVQTESVFGQALELGEADFRHAPEAFDSIYMDRPSCELVLGMVDAAMPVAEVDQSVIAAPSVGVDDGPGIDIAPDNAL